MSTPETFSDRHKAQSASLRIRTAPNECLWTRYHCYDIEDATSDSVGVMRTPWRGRDVSGRRTVTDADIVILWDAGASMGSIGRALGLSRERVRQRLERNGRRGRQQPSHAPAEGLRQAARECRSYDEMARLLSLPVHRVAAAIRFRGLKDEVVLAFARNRRRDLRVRREFGRRRAIAVIRRLAIERGRTPTVPELKAHNLPLFRLRQLFGSAAAATRAALLTPNLGGRVAGLPEWIDRADSDAKTARRSGR